MMGTRSEHAPGTFSWVDLSTGDAAAAKSFYGGLFGWDFEDNEIPDGGVYMMCKVGGASVCAIAEQGEVSPHWNNYVSVGDAEATVAKARDLGATIIEEAFDVVDAGRLGVVSDPTGAAFCVWEPKQNIGAEVVNVPGALTWNELHTPDLAAATAFYGDLFGWTFDAIDTGGGPAYQVIRNGERANGGAMDAQPGEPPNWLPYFAVASLDEAIEGVTGAGGELRAGPIPFPAGRIAVVADPQDAPFALWEGELED
jgi:predicted enzyme related to lactoylglutathione lyase